MTTYCVAPDCREIGVIEGKYTLPDGAEELGWVCFNHWIPDGMPPAATPADGGDVVHHAPTELAMAQAPSFDEVSFSAEVTAGLAAMLLEHTAMALRDDPGAITEAVRLLAGNTAFTDDVATGILLALTYIAAAGGVTDEMLTAGAERYEQMAEAEADTDDAGTIEATAEVAPMGADEAAAGGLHHVSEAAEHYRRELVGQVLDDTADAIEDERGE